MPQFAARYILIPALIGAIIGGALLLLDYTKTIEKPGYAKAVDQAASSVVNIYSNKIIRRKTPPICQLERFKDWCEMYSDSGRRMQSSLGSGVIVRSNGYILTNNHVIADADEILVAFADGQAAAATLVGADVETDLAVIKVEAQGLQPIEIGASDSVRVGDIALAIGNPFGIGQTVSMGIISAKGRAGISASPYDDFMQTDAAINPGNSGGALINTDGELIGLNTLIYSRSGGSEGIGFAIPSKLALSVVDEVVSQGFVTRGWLGIILENAPDNRTVGLQVTGIRRGGPAFTAGVLPGDLLLSVNDIPAVSSRAITRKIAQVAPGDPIHLDIIRNGETQTLEATAGQRPYNRPEPQ